MSGPLSGVTVIELAGLGPAPFAGMMLADLGADVVQVVRPGHARSPHDKATRTDVLNRGKRSVAIDLKDATGVDIVLRLLADADVLLEGYRPGVTERFGLGPDVCLQRNPSLVYGRMTGWGQTGPLADRAGHDIDYIAVAGALGSIGSPDPVPPLNLVGDFGGGGMLLVVGVLAALYRAGSTGDGEVVDAAMTDGTALLLAMQHGLMAGGMWTDERSANLLDGGAPFYTTYATSDGEWMAVGALEPQFYRELVERLGLAGAELPEQMDREGWRRLRDEFSLVFKTKSRSEWETVFAGSDACASGVYSLEESTMHPHNTARGTFVEVDGITQPAPAPRFERSPTTAGAVPIPGEHTASILGGLGYDPEDISTMRERGVIR